LQKQGKTGGGGELPRLHVPGNPFDLCGFRQRLMVPRSVMFPTFRVHPAFFFIFIETPFVEVNARGAGQKFPLLLPQTTARFNLLVQR
jgi:hypothetical protein